MVLNVFGKVFGFVGSGAIVLGGYGLRNEFEGLRNEFESLSRGL